MSNPETEIPTAYTNRTIDLIRAAEGEAENVASELGTLSKKIINDLEMFFGTKNASLSQRDMDYMVSTISPSIERYYGKVLPEELKTIQADIIRKEIVWNANTLENARNGQPLISSRSFVKGVADDLESLDLDRTFYRVGGAFRKGFTTDLKFASSKIYDAVVKEGVVDAGKNYLPKGKIADLASDAALRKQYADWIIEKGLDPVYFGKNGNLSADHFDSFKYFAKQTNQDFIGINTEQTIQNVSGSGASSEEIQTISLFDEYSARPIQSVVTVEKLIQYTAVAESIPFQGKLFSDHVKSLYPRRYEKLQTALRNSFNEGLSVQQTTARIKNDVLGSINAETKTLVRSHFMHNAVTAKDIVYNSNPDLIEAIIWNSTLDARTTPLICGIRDGKWYSPLLKTPMGHGLEWGQGPGRMHWNCRSSSYPKLFGIDSQMNRPTVSGGATYQRGDKWNSKGKARKNAKDLRDKGIIKTPEQKGGSYEDWLRKQPLAMQQDILGVARAKAFRDGGELGKLGGGNSGGGPVRGKKPIPKIPTKKIPPKPKSFRGRKPVSGTPKPKTKTKTGTKPASKKTKPVAEKPTPIPSKPEVKVKTGKTSPPISPIEAHTKLWDSADPTIKKNWPKIPKEYVPFKNRNDAAAYAELNGFAQHVDFGELHMDIVNEMNAAMHQHVQDFPVFKGRMSFMGSTKVRNQLRLEETIRKEAANYMTQIRNMQAQNSGASIVKWAGETEEEAAKHFRGYMEPIELGGETASAIPKCPGTIWDSLAWNDKKASESYWKKNGEAEIRSFVRSHTPDEFGVSHWAIIDKPDSLRYIMDHELGHQLDFLMDVKNQNEIMDMYDKGMLERTVPSPIQMQNSSGPVFKMDGTPMMQSSQTLKFLETELSHYSIAREDNPASEMIAEAWAEYRNSKTPRPYAKKIGDFIMNRYKTNH